MFLITGLGVGGAERQVIDLAERLCARGHQLIVVYLTGEARMLPGDPAIRVIGLNMGKSPVELVRVLFRLKGVVSEYQPDVIHSHMVHANIVARLLRILVRVPLLVCTAHNTYEGGWLRMIAYRVTDCLADVTTNVSQEAVSAFENAGAARRGRMIAVTNGIDTARFAPDTELRRVTRSRESVPDDAKIVLAVGRLTEAKDYPNLLKACRLLFGDVNDASLWIVGGGRLENDLKALVLEYGLSGRVRFLGVRADVPALMNAADMFVLPSAWEGFGLVVAEAMACGKVVVATDSGGVREVVGGCGFLVPPCDAGALADGLYKALRLADRERACMEKEARQRVERLFALDGTVDRWLALYRSSAA